MYPYVYLHKVCQSILPALLAIAGSQRRWGAHSCFCPLVSWTLLTLTYLFSVGSSLGWVWGFVLEKLCANSSVRFSHSVMSHSLRPHESQHARAPCPSPTPGVYSNSCPSSWWCHPAISCSVVSPSPPAPNPSQHQSLFQWVSSSHEVAKVLDFQL